ncbi:MAG: hypothetical protein JSU63_14540 [Phycisphaerales bacterium]|nr:MAG: hypothetical protein JSU63_14540 [Phycisphaerales bacterium]
MSLTDKHSAVSRAGGQLERRASACAGSRELDPAVRRMMTESGRDRTRRGRTYCRWHVLSIACVLVATPWTPGQTTETIQVKLKLLTGGALRGLVVEQTDHGLVVVAQSTPYVFSWGEVETGSAYAAKKAWLALVRGGRENVIAEDHFQLGRFLLGRGRNSQAAAEFRKAKRLDPDYAGLVRDALADYRRKKETMADSDSLPESAADEQSVDNSTEWSLVEQINAGSFGGAGQATAVGTTPEIQAQALGIYKTFGERVRDVIDKKLALVETDHFLIWTDWEKLSRQKLADSCEAMYTALCDQFGFDPANNVFLAKCPVFCWRSKARFLKFARTFDGYDGKESIGYSRSIQKNGHVHLVLLRTGRSDADFDRFACTLVHEGTHAFLHRFHSTRLIPHWVNEGFADLMAERVLGDRCPNAENAALLAGQYVRYDWPVDDLLRSTGPIGVHQYALAHGLVAHLESKGAGRAGGFVKSLKEGMGVADALAANYDGLTLEQLEAGWRRSIRERIGQTDP